MGKTLRVSDFDLKFGNTDHLIDVYAIFKDVKKADILAIYSDLADENKSSLHYASVHIKEDGIVLIDVKDKEEIIKEFTWKMINNRENEGFQIYNIDKFEKAEIVSSNQLLVKADVIKLLHDKTIPKPVEAKKVKEKKKISSSSKILLTGFSLTFLVILAFLLTHRDLLQGTNIKYRCTNAYLDTEIGTNREEVQDITFNLKNELTTRTIITKLKFNNQSEYEEYDNAGTYFNWQTKFQESRLDYERDKKNLTFSVIEYVKLEELYNGKLTKQELLDELSNNDYECIDVSE